MCLIIDTCIASRVLVSEDDEDFCHVKKALLSKKAVMVYGGDLRREYLKASSIACVVRVLDQAGVAVAIPDDKVDSEAKKVMKLGICRSKDYHILGLARITGARLLCTGDGNLIDDFKNASIVQRPRGKIYKSSAHVGLLKKKCRLCK